MPRGKTPWTPERRQRMSEAQKAGWARKRERGIVRIPVRNDVHIFREWYEVPRRTRRDHARKVPLFFLRIRSMNPEDTHHADWSAR